MPVVTNAGSGYLIRAITGVSFSADWTRLQWVKFPADPTGANYYTVFYTINVALTDWVGGFAYLSPGFVQDAEADRNGMFQQIQTPTSSGTWIHRAVRYTALTHLLELLINAVVVGSVTIDLSPAATWENAFDHLGWDDASTLTGNSVAYDRIWQATLSTSEIAAEMGAQTAVRQTNLIADNPLQTASDLAALNNPLLIWSVIGSVTTAPDAPPLGARITQLPLEAAYNYAQIQRYLQGGGLDWVTPPQTLTRDRR